MRRTLIAIASVVAIVAVVILVRKLPPPPSVDGSVAPAAEATPLSADGGIDPNALLSTEAPVDPNAPIVIDPAAPEVSAFVGQSLTFAVPDSEQMAIHVESDKTEVVDVYDGTDDSGIALPPGGDVLGPGTAVITITNADGTASLVTVTASAME